MLLLAVAVVGAAFLLGVREDGRVAVRGLPGHPLPPACPSRELAGVPCPLCGLTRSLVLLAQGDGQGSLRQHRLGWLLAGLVLLQIPYRLAALFWPQRIRRSGCGARWLLYGLLVLFLGNWLWGMLSGELN
jgi:hypothetical protein